MQSYHALCYSHNTWSKSTESQTHISHSHGIIQYFCIKIFAHLLLKNLCVEDESWLEWPGGWSKVWAQREKVRDRKIDQPNMGENLKNVWFSVECDWEKSSSKATSVHVGLQGIKHRQSDLRLWWTVWLFDCSSIDFYRDRQPRWTVTCFSVGVYVCVSTRIYLLRSMVCHTSCLVTILWKSRESCFSATILSLK